MDNTRTLVTGICNRLHEVNDSYSRSDKEKNKAAYESLRDVAAVLETLGCKVSITETWDRGLVSCEITIEGVKF